MGELVVKSFPRNELEALAMLYVQNLDLTDIAPEELLELYDTAYEAMVAVRNEQDEAKYKKF